MLDVLCDGQYLDPLYGRIRKFNDIPGGANVLYMDGHVAFIKYPSKFPVSKLTAWSLGAPGIEM
jgi:prepilin-type processing-associated H-X9-DG protein